MRILYITLFILFILLISFFTVKYFKDHPCVEYKDVCQEQYTYITYNVALKMPMPTTGYRDVDCSKPHDNVIQRCVKRK
ncbi:MAG: hypothetical protein ACFFG0_10415 [Candidatus Thorarchaeota archaeon]